MIALILCRVDALCLLRSGSIHERLEDHYGFYAMLNFFGYYVVGAAISRLELRYRMLPHETFDFLSKFHLASTPLLPLRFLISRHQHHCRRTL